MAFTMSLCAAASAFQATPPATSHALTSAARRRPLPWLLTRAGAAASLTPDRLPSSPSSAEAPSSSLRPRPGAPKLLNDLRKVQRPAGVFALTVSLLATVGRLPTLFAGVASIGLVDLFFEKFASNWKLYLTIPMVAGLLNWATNRLAVAMIFYPLEFKGWNLKVWPGQPLGLFGWTGIVPCKADVLATRLVRMVTGSLIDVDQVFRRLDPDRVAALLVPGLRPTAAAVARDLGGPGGIAAWALKAGGEVSGAAADDLMAAYVSGLTRRVAADVRAVWDLEGMCVRALVANKKLLVELFQACGKAELQFVVQSGLWLGGALGVVQMAVWVAWDPPWSLALGGALVGYLTNLVAIKSIFWPVRPRQVGPFTFQGLFLTRQNEVSTQFAQFVATKVLTSEAIWAEVLYGAKRPQLDALALAHADQMFEDRKGLFGLVALGAGVDRATVVHIVATRALEGLEREVTRLHPYVDATLGLEADMEASMRRLSPEAFEGVLHPIFEEDEATLIGIGAGLGLAAGALQALAPY